MGAYLPALALLGGLLAIAVYGFMRSAQAVESHKRRASHMNEGNETTTTRPV